MLPLVQGFLISILCILGALGVLVIYLGGKKIVVGHRNWKNFAVLFSGFPLIVFVLCNYVGYRAIFSENERPIIGVFTDESRSKTLNVLPNHEWEIRDDFGKHSIRGSWEYTMSEDGDYWSFTSDIFPYRSQTFSSNRIRLNRKRLVFRK